MRSLIRLLLLIASMSSAGWALPAEESVYRIEAFGLPVVEMSLRLAPQPEERILVVGTARTVGVGSWLYRISNRYECLLAGEQRLPLWWQKTIKQADLEQTLVATPDREAGIVDYGAAGTRSLAPGASWFVAEAATAHLMPWATGQERLRTLEMEGRTLILKLRAVGTEERQVLGRMCSCIVIEGSFEEPEPRSIDLLPRTDMLTYHVVDDDYIWQLVITREPPHLLAAMELEKEDSTIKARLIRHSLDGREEHEPRGGRFSRSRNRQGQR